MTGLKVASLNTRGLNNKLKRKSIFNICKNNDITCLQETYITDEKIDTWSKDWPGKIFYTCGTNHSKGQIILVNNRLKFDKIEILSKRDRILGIKILFQNHFFNIYNIYAPNDSAGKKKFISDLHSIFNTCDRENTIICGDFNIVLDNNLDICSGEAHPSDLVQKFNDWVNNSSLCDTWRTINGQTKEYTWSKSNPFISRRLDFIFASENLIPQVTESKHIFVSGTDHKMIISNFITDNFKRGKSFWKLNTSLLNDINYLNEMNAHIDNFLLNNSYEFENPAEKFEMLKVMIKTETIDYCTKINMYNNYKEKKLLNEIRSLESEIILHPQHKEILSALEKKKKEIEILQMHKTKGAIIRSRAKYIKDGEKNSKYFLNLEKSRGNFNTILSVQDDNGQRHNDHFEIIKTIKNYYENVSKKDNSVKSDSVSFNEFLKNIEHPVLPDVEKNALDSQITVNELGHALSKLNNNSAPGIDGLPIPFYKTFWSKLKQPLFESIQFAVQVGELSSSQKRGVITLLHKGKHLKRDELKNWRPITLTNTDYKIFSKTLAIRLQSTLPDLININQSGFMKNRSISDHIRTIDDLICLSNSSNNSGMIVSLDFAKAFDSIDTNAIFNALDKFNFGRNYINMIKTLVNKNKSCVQNGGWLSDWFDIERGIKQGCCVSPLLFILVVEIMAIKIRSEQSISGIRISSGKYNSNPIKILQYCDDTTLTLSSSNELTSAIKIIDNFSNIAGLKLNKTKSKGMWIGKEKDNTSTPGNISWVKPNENLKILGIYFNSQKEASDIESNWKEKIEEIKDLMRRWQKYEPSLYGKIIICKTFLLSKISYAIQSLSMPENVLTQIDTLFFKFIWQTKHSHRKAREKIKRSVMCKSVEKGGLRMIRAKDQQRVFLLKWLRHYIITDNRSNLTFSNLLELYFHKMGGINYVLSTSIHSSKLKFSPEIPRFWRDVIKIWIDIKQKDALDSYEDPSNILLEPLFNNKNIMYKNSPLNFSKWIKTGITHILDVFDKGTFIPCDLIANKVGRSGILDFEYNALFNGIPNSWKTSLLDLNYFNLNIDNLKKSLQNQTYHLTLLNKKNSELREIIGENDTSTICGKMFWMRKYDIDISKHFILAYNATKESRLRLLHFKILHNIFPSNILLNRMGIKETELCDFCGEKDVIEHMFIHCSRLKGFWTMVMCTIFSRTNIRVEITDHNILFGISRTDPKTKTSDLNIVNHIILIAKMCISKTKFGTYSNLFMNFELEISAREHYLKY